MFSRRYSYPGKSVIRMDPDCAICHAPANMACECEAKGLDVAVKQAEDRMMRSIYTEIRSWVRGHAQDYILEYFRLLTDQRKTAHAAHMDRINAHAYHYYHAPPHPTQVAEAQASLKRGIDEDWQASVQRYPEVLEYFFGLVELTLPAEDEPAVKDPPLGQLSSSRKVNRRNSNNPPGAAGAVVPPGYRDPGLMHQEPPPMPNRSSRTPGPGGMRRPNYGAPPPMPGAYNYPPPPPPY